MWRNVTILTDIVFGKESHMKKKLVSMLVVSGIMLGGFGSQKGYAAENPSYQEINRMLTEAALKKDIPPEIAKAVALQESSWDHFVNGEPNNVNGGIGLMQVTNDLRFDQKRLGTDIQYNIEAGLYILDEKFKDLELPRLNDMNRDVLENWYFALLAYNGKVQRNSPIYRADGTSNTNAYQEKIFSKVHYHNGEMGVYPLPYQFKIEDFTYDPSSARLYFNKDQYLVGNHLLHETKHKFEKDDIVLSAVTQSFRSGPATNTSSVGLAPKGEREAITILESGNKDGLPFVYDQSYNYDRDDKPVDMRFRQPVWYKTLRNDGKSTGYVASGELIPLGKRLHGSNRFATAAAVSREGWQAKSDTVVIAFGYDFPDALAGAPLAYQLDAPLLLSNEEELSPATENEIKRLGAKNAVILGSSGLIKPIVEQKLNALGVTQITRYGGADRFETATKIAAQLPKKDTAILARGYDFPDALAIASYAAEKGYPILLTRDYEVPESTANALKNYENIIVVGDEGVIPDSLLKSVNKTGFTRYGGKSRYDTNAAIVNGLYNGVDTAYIARGYNFPDALTGAVLAAKKRAPILLSNDVDVPDVTETTILKHKMDSFGFLGGQSVLDVQNEIGKIVGKINY